LLDDGCAAVGNQGLEVAIEVSAKLVAG